MHTWEENIPMAANATMRAATVGKITARQVDDFIVEIARRLESANKIG